ncbi:hypothetical protein HY405_02065 [Candidatus Microgenomates bacterium]|nr:hypothetical protein [Candidatus Microgenomates bacterium]
MDREHEAVFLVSERFAPKEEDWVKLQGGKPTVVHVRGEIFNIIHDYKDGSCAIVPTSHPESYGNVRIGMRNGRTCDFPVALVWKLHGQPCEARSKVRYERKG